MNIMEQHKNRLLLLVIIILTAAILFPSNPRHSYLPSRDSGVFLYTGQSILNGQIPYKDVWDHKGPLIYFINAFGLSISGGSMWGVWVLILLFLSAASIISYELLRRCFSQFSAMFATILWVISLGCVIEDGNFTETYALLFQFIGLYLFYQASSLSEKRDGTAYPQ